MTSNTARYVDTVVVGGGQAGLAIGYYLRKQEGDFVVLDDSERIGDTWRNRWDSLRLFSQARFLGLPRFPFPAPSDYYPTKDEMADYLEMYATWFDLPVQLNTRAETLTRNDDRYALVTESRRFVADHVVVATGFHNPNIPEFAPELDPTITQLHSSEYQNPSQLPSDDVLVVGASNSGAHIAMELADSGRRIWLSGRDTGSVPINIVNSRILQWLADTVLTVDTIIGRKAKKYYQEHGEPLVRFTPKDIRRTSVERVPRTNGVVNGMPHLKDGRVLDLTTIIWATGFHPNFDWIELPIIGDDGYPNHYRGVVDGVSGLYFLGLRFQYSIFSSDVDAVSDDAKYIHNHIKKRRKTTDHT